MLHLLVLLGILFLPSLIARSRNHPSFVPILLVNLLLSWTFIGWIIALVWACTPPPIPMAYVSVYPPAGTPGNPYSGHPGYAGRSGYAGHARYAGTSGRTAPVPQILPPAPYQGRR